MSEYTSIEDKMYSKESSAHVSSDEKDVEEYLDKVEKQYHKARREDWYNNYKINYRNRHKNQIKMRKSELD